ncbi:sigma-70 family RNA polymerase sigma factor [Arenibacter sp. GZD96]|uniref:RNA polymerase sigma factor n=1 Tax=Aurantibrevibacter litoralis TaxID=3106030 RepID=UPI002AFE9846|nr:sigma-70 family RNA polymerase sigma factor [Arenibacter sp. GZD-96]MEA1787544.1 sigma-70 family RNA polymerase sigma factor [Arenibacter sp. GZD-96]
MNPELDQPFIAQTLKGDTKAFAVLVDRYKHMVFTLALRIVKNNEDAEEVAQDTFVNVYTQLPKFKGEAKFSTWVYKIAYHKSLDVLKRQKRNRETASIADLKAIHSGQAEEVMELQDRKKVIKKAMDTLDAEDALVITLFYYEECSLEEISKIMSLSVNTLKVRLFRSRKKLAEVLKGLLKLEKI